MTPDELAEYEASIMDDCLPPQDARTDIPWLPATWHQLEFPDARTDD